MIVFVAANEAFTLNVTVFIYYHDASSLLRFHGVLYCSYFYLNVWEQLLLFECPNQSCTEVKVKCTELYFDSGLSAICFVLPRTVTEAMALSWDSLLCTLYTPESTTVTKLRVRAPVRTLTDALPL